MRLNVAPALPLTCTQHGDRLTLRPYGGHEALFCADAAKFLTLPEPFLRIDSWNFGPMPSVTFVLPASYRALDDALDACTSHDERAELIISMLQTLHRMGEVDGLTREGVFIDATGAFHFTPGFDGIVAQTASGMMWEGSEYKSFCISNASPSVANTVSRLTLRWWEDEYDKGITPLSERCPPLAPLAPMIKDTTGDDWSTRWWNAVVVIDDTLRSRR